MENPNPNPDGKMMKKGERERDNTLNDDDKLHSLRKRMFLIFK